MSIERKIGYLKGLMEGLDFDKESNEGKLILCMADILDDLAAELQEAQDDIDDINEYLEAVDEDLSTVEEELFDIDDEDECDCCGEPCCCTGEEEEEEDCYEVTCPNCENTIVLEEFPEADTLVCPSCKETIELEK